MNWATTKELVLYNTRPSVGYYAEMNVSVVVYMCKTRVHFYKNSNSFCTYHTTHKCDCDFKGEGAEKMYAEKSWEHRKKSMWKHYNDIIFESV